MKKTEKTYIPPKNIPLQVSEPEILFAVMQNKIRTGHLADLKEISGLKDEILSDSLNISLKTFRNYKEADLAMKPHLQEHVFSLLSLYGHGIEVFGSSTQFNEWLQKANFFFDNDKPINFFTTISGIKHIDSRLTAIQYGDNV